jgi:hypothetical protein
VASRGSVRHTPRQLVGLVAAASPLRDCGYFRCGLGEGCASLVALAAEDPFGTRATKCGATSIVVRDGVAEVREVDSDLMRTAHSWFTLHECRA